MRIISRLFSNLCMVNVSKALAGRVQPSFGDHFAHLGAINRLEVKIAAVSYCLKVKALQKVASRCNHRISDTFIASWPTFVAKY